MGNGLHVSCCEIDKSFTWLHYENETSYLNVRGWHGFLSYVRETNYLSDSMVCGSQQGILRPDVK